jgi:tetratricopeptide (TPR) repeat protein
MSMHEIENLVESSVRLLAQYTTKKNDNRSLYLALFNYQNRWDTKNTTFRVMDILLESNAYYFISVKDHPEYSLFQPFFDELLASESVDFKPIYSIPDQPWRAKNNREIGIFCRYTDLMDKNFPGVKRPEFAEPGIYFAAGSSIWSGLVAKKFFQAKDAVPPKQLSISEVVLEVVTTAKKADNISLISGWYAMLGADLVIQEKCPESKDKKRFDKILNIVSKTDACAYNNGHAMTALPTEEVLKKISGQIANWWYLPLKKYYEKKDTNYIYWMQESAKLINQLRHLANVKDGINRLGDEMIKRYHKKDRAAIKAAYNDKMRDTLQNIESVIGTGVALKNRAEFHMNLGIAYGIMQEHDSALMAYNRALELDKKIAVLWAYRGFTHHLRGEKKKAHDDYREALKIEPENEFAKYYLENDPQKEK